MKTEMADTSLLAYNELKEKNLLIGKRLDVYNAIKKIGCGTNKMIARYLSWEINRVTGRVNELAEGGVIRLSKKEICPIGGKLAQWWSVINEQKQLGLWE